MLLCAPLINVFFYEDTAMMHKGTVKWTDNKHNCGFIIPDDANAQNIFIHVSQFKKLGVDSPKDGQRVWFQSRNTLENYSILGCLPEILCIH